MDLLEVLLLRRLIMASWDVVAQETRIRLERVQKQSGIIEGRVAGLGENKNEGGGWILRVKSS